MPWSGVPITICTPKSLPSDYFKKSIQGGIKNTFDSSVFLDNFDKLFQSRTYLSKQSEIREIDGKSDSFHYWKIVEQVTSFVKDKHSYRVSLVTFEYGNVNLSNQKLVEDSNSKIFFQIQITNYDVVKHGYFTEIHLNIDKTCIALVSQSSCCVCHLPNLENEITTKINSKKFGPVCIVPNAYTGYLLHDVHLNESNNFYTMDERDLYYKTSSHIVKVKWHHNFNNFICILEKNSNNRHFDFQTYFRIYNISKNIDVPVYKLKIDSSAWKNTFCRTMDYKDSDTIHNMCYGDEKDLSFDTNVKLEHENSGNIVDFTIGIHDPDNVWQEYTLYLLHEYGFVYIYTPIIFFDLNLSNEDRVMMISNTTYHLLNSNFISTENLSQELYTELNLLLYSSSESIHNPRLICTTFSQGHDMNTSFVILSHSPTFIFAIINSLGTLSIYASDFSLFPSVPALANYWSQSIDSVCIYTINYSILNPVLFPVKNSQESVLIYSTKSYYFLMLNMSTCDGSKIISSKYSSYMKNKNLDNIVELTYGGCNILLFNALMSKLDQGYSIYSHPCYIHTSDRSEISVFVNEYPIECRFMRPLGFCAIRPVIEKGCSDNNLSVNCITGEIQKFRNEFTDLLEKVRNEMATKNSMVNKTFNILTSLQSLHRTVNRFNELEKFYSFLLVKVKETHEDNIKNTLEYIDSSATHSSQVKSIIQDRIDKIKKCNGIIQSRYKNINTVFKDLVAKNECQNVKVYYNNFMTRIDCIIAEFVHLYLQYQCIECIKLRAQINGYETIKDKPVLSRFGPSVATLEHLLTSGSYSSTSASLLKSFPRSLSRDPPRSTISQLSRSQRSHSQISRKEAMDMKLSCEDKGQVLSCENCIMLKDAFKKYIVLIKNINRGLNKAVF